MAAWHRYRSLWVTAPGHAEFWALLDLSLSHAGSLSWQEDAPVELRHAGGGPPLPRYAMNEAVGNFELHGRLPWQDDAFEAAHAQSARLPLALVERSANLGQDLPDDWLATGDVQDGRVARVERVAAKALAAALYGLHERLPSIRLLVPHGDAAQVTFEEVKAWAEPAGVNPVVLAGRSVTVSEPGGRSCVVSVHEVESVHEAWELLLPAPLVEPGPVRAWLWAMFGLAALAAVFYALGPTTPEGSGLAEPEPPTATASPVSAAVPTPPSEPPPATPEGPPPAPAAPAQTCSGTAAHVCSGVEGTLERYGCTTWAVTVDRGEATAEGSEWTLEIRAGGRTLRRCDLAGASLHAGPKPPDRAPHDVQSAAIGCAEELCR